MIGYGALLDSSFGREVRSSWFGLTNMIGDLPFYYYIIAILIIVLLTRILTTR